MPKPNEVETILIVDDSVETLELLKRNINDFNKDCQVFTTTNVTDAVKKLKTIPIDIVITDLQMPEINGMHLVKFVRDNYKNTEILVITGFPSVETAVESIKYGADEYLIKPFTDKEFFIALHKVTDKLITHKLLNNHKNTNGNIFGIIGESKPMLGVFNMIEKISTTNATVLISGESGTGKELVARAIHYRSNRSSMPFIAINCAALPSDLLESELFGHTKGAFTGANESRSGFFQMADKGTIFLDEISNTSPSMQAKLLRVLQEKEFYMVGDKKPIKVDTRVITATNVDLLHLIKKDNFREDLFYRLNVVNIHVPPLRDRNNDIVLLINYFASRYTKELGKSDVPVFSDNAIHALKEYHWPGNVRELQNLIYNLIILAEENKIDPSDLPQKMRYCIQSSSNVNKSLETLEKEHILDVLASVNNNKSAAAKILGIDRKTLRDKLKNNQSKTDNN
ncbi:MAG: sigma-54-dependent Fis family transcriptional regulator [Bacteroidetes bacterium]|nr:sigma-54-dependent Fis family transcriptional regulator [Bacteroidota bacterium]